jgi:hypothetical protein
MERATLSLRPSLAPAGGVPARAKRRQESCGPKAASGGTERDQPRNPLHRGRRPVCNGGEGSSGRSPGRERTRVHRGLSRRHAGTGSARNPGDPLVPAGRCRGRRPQGQPEGRRAAGGSRIGPYYRGSEGKPRGGKGPTDQRVVGVAHGGHAEAHYHVPVALAAHPHRCAGLKSPVREIRTPGSVGGRRGNPAPYPT